MERWVLGQDSQKKKQADPPHKKQIIVQKRAFKLYPAFCTFLPIVVFNSNQELQ